MMFIVRKLLGILTPKEKKNASILLFVLLVSAVIELLGIAAVLPYVNLVLNPQLLQENRWLILLTSTLGIEEENTALKIVGLICLVLFSFGTLIKSLSNYLILRFSHRRMYAVGVRLLTQYFNLDFEDFSKKHSSEYLKVILTEVTQVTSGILMPLLNLVAHGLVILLITIFLVLIEPVAAILVLLTVPSSYLITYWIIRKKLESLGKSRDEANALRYSSLSEAVNGIRDLKLGSKHSIFIDRFSGASRDYARSVYVSQSIVILPKYILELVIFGGMLLGILVLLGDPSTLKIYMPLMAVYAFSGYRLLPSAQMVYATFSNLKFSLPSLENVSSISDLGVEQNTPSEEYDPNFKVKFEKSIALKNVAFGYKGAEDKIFKTLSLTIKKGEVIGIVGPTGSGKSTLIDLILGLLHPSDGDLMIDDTKLSGSNIVDWQRQISYVPQAIYLLDDTFTNNIAFGVSEAQVDFERVLEVSRIAKISNFIETYGTAGFDSIIGERGVRLSGGQRQRLGIARALYSKSHLLVLDEATSALDSTMEAKIIEGLMESFSDKTIIMIAHRVSTLNRCDKILEVKDGCVRWLSNQEIVALT